MDKKYWAILVIISLIIIATIVVIIPNPSPSQSPDSNNVLRTTIGKTDTETTLYNYITDKKEQQTVQQRHNTLKLYISLLDTGKKNTDKTQSINEAPEVCDLAIKTAGEGTDIEKAEKIANYLGDFEYDWGNVVIDATGRPRISAKKTPSEVIEVKKGLCGELANTYLLMGECLNIPTYFVWGGGHAWNAVIIDDKIIEVDNTQDCFDCDSLQPEHNYPVVGLCSREKCININMIAERAQNNLFDQTMGK